MFLSDENLKNAQQMAFNNQGFIKSCQDLALQYFILLYIYF